MRLNGHSSDESVRRWRERMIEETCQFIEWGLDHPDNVEWIPSHPVGRGAFSERVKMMFWTLIAQNTGEPDEE